MKMEDGKTTEGSRDRVTVLLEGMKAMDGLLLVMWRVGQRADTTYRERFFVLRREYLEREIDAEPHCRFGVAKRGYRGEVKGCEHGPERGFHAPNSFISRFWCSVLIRHKIRGRWRETRRSWGKITATKHECMITKTRTNPTNVFHKAALTQVFNRSLFH